MSKFTIFLKEPYYDPPAKEKKADSTKKLNDMKDKCKASFIKEIKDLIKSKIITILKNTQELQVDIDVQNGKEDEVRDILRLIDVVNIIDQEFVGEIKETREIKKKKLELK